MTRTTRNISLGLLGSAVLTACFLSCSGCGSTRQRQVVGYDKDGKPIYSTATTRSGYRRSGWSFFRPSYYGGGGSSFAPAPSGGSSGGSKSSPSFGGGSTSRGGFGGIGSGGS